MYNKWVYIDANINTIINKYKQIVFVINYINNNNNNTKVPTFFYK